MAAQSAAKKSAKTAKQPAKNDEEDRQEDSQEDSTESRQEASSHVCDEDRQEGGGQGRRQGGRRGREAPRAGHPRYAGQRTGTAGGADRAARRRCRPSPTRARRTPARPPGPRPTPSPTDAAQQGAFLTTATGARLLDTDHSLKAGPRGPDPAAGPPPAREDHPLRPRAHPRARRARPRRRRARRLRRATAPRTAVTRAGFLAKGKETPVFVRFSTVLGSRGSADTVRDTRGFATKFYTDEGTFDLVGNNIPVFFIQDGIKFPDVIHAGKPHPDREIPQAQSAHDTFWDFVSLHTEAQHHTIWNMSDRGIPRSYRTMEGFGVHTFRLRQRRRRDRRWSSSTGSPCWACTRWPGRRRRCSAASTPTSTAATSPTRSRPAPSRSGSSASRSSRTPRGPDVRGHRPARPDQARARGARAGAADRPARPSTRNPTNFFAETEQVAFHVGHLVPGHRRHRRPAAAGAAVLLRRHPAHPAGRAELHPDPDQPAARAGQRHAARRLPPARGPRAASRRTGRTRSTAAARSSPATDDGAFVDVAGAGRRGDQGAGQPGVVRRPLQPGAPVLAEHDAGRAGAHRPRLHLRARQVLRAGDQGAPAAVPGQHRPGPVRARSPPGSACRRRSRRSTLADLDPSPALSQVGGEWPPDGRIGRHRRRPRRRPRRRRQRCAATIDAAGMVPLVIAPHGGTVGRQLPVQRTFATAPLRRVRRAAARRRAGPGARRAARPRRQGGRPARPPTRRPAGAAAGRGVLPARQGDRRLGRRASGPSTRPDRTGAAGVVTGDDAGRGLRRGPGADGRPPRLGAVPVRRSPDTNQP